MTSNCPFPSIPCPACIDHELNLFKKELLKVQYSLLIHIKPFLVLQKTAGQQNSNEPVFRVPRLMSDDAYNRYVRKENTTFFHTTFFHESRFKSWTELNIGKQMPDRDWANSSGP